MYKCDFSLHRLFRYPKKCNYLLKFQGKTIYSSPVYQSEVATFADFNKIPGPKSYPVIGTLYTYLPFIGKIFCFGFYFFIIKLKYLTGIG